MKVIDQSVLPHKLRFIYSSSVKSVWDIIREMKIRGAPLFGVAAA